MKTILLSAALFMGTSAFAQSSEALAANTNEEKKTELTAPAPTKAKEISLTVRNGAERKISVYSGNKKEVFSGKATVLGGLSNNIMYLMEGDVVCIMDDPKTIHACSILKEGMTKVEINSSGNGFVK